MRTNCQFAQALHLLAVLAYREGDPVSSECLSGSLNIHPVMVRRLLRALQEARLVETRKGPHAGSRLSRAAAHIDLAEVYRAVCGGKMFGLPRRHPNGQCPVGRGVGAALEPLFASAQEALERELAHATVGSLLESIRSAV